MLLADVDAEFAATDSVNVVVGDAVVAACPLLLPRLETEVDSCRLTSEPSEVSWAVDRLADVTVAGDADGDDAVLLPDATLPSSTGHRLHN